jgi:hypothetical protein
MTRAILIGVAVNPAIVGQVRAFAAAAGSTVAATTQAAKQGLSFGQHRRVYRGIRFHRDWPVD